MRSIGRALDVLDLLRGAGPHGLRVTDLALRVGVDAATISRTLATLVSRGYASRLANRRYTLGPWSARLPERWIDRVLQSAGPTLGELTQTTGETVYLLELLGGRAVTVASMRPSQRPVFDCEGGASFPPWATAAGHALLGGLNAGERLLTLPPEPYDACTPATPTRWSELTRLLEIGNREGIFHERGCFDSKLECLATRLDLAGGGKLALAMSFPRDSRGDAERARLKRLLRSAGAQIV